MSGRRPLSVAVITLDEEINLARCLGSVAWADERIVVDAGSTDRTREIAERLGARVVVEPWRGFVAAKNRAVELASHDWVLSLDADEWLSEEAATEIAELLHDPRCRAYRLPRRSAFCGAFLGRVWSRDRPLRLFRRDCGRFDGGPVHESFRVAPGTVVGRLRHPILHLTYRSLEDYVSRLNRYTTLAARGLKEGGRRGGWVWMVLSPPAKFLRVYIVDGGFLDGVRGWIVAVGSAFYTFMKHAKRWELDRDVDPELVRLAGSTAEDPNPASPPGAQSG